MKHIPREIQSLVKIAESIQEEFGKITAPLLIRRAWITYAKAQEVIDFLK